MLSQSRAAASTQGGSQRRVTTHARKIELLNEIRAGWLSPAEALVQFGIAPEELSRWQELVVLGGGPALMATKVQKYR